MEGEPSATGNAFHAAPNRHRFRICHPTIKTTSSAASLDRLRWLKGARKLRISGVEGAQLYRHIPCPRHSTSG